MGIFICGCGRNFKRGFVNVPEKYIYVEQNLSKKISVLENAGSTKAAALMQMIIEEIQLRQANYRYTVSTLAFNLVLFFDRLDNENIKFQNNSRETSDYTRKIISYIELHYMEDIGAITTPLTGSRRASVKDVSATGLRTFRTGESAVTVIGELH